MTSTSTTILFWEKEGKFKRLLVCEKSPIQQKKNSTYIKYYGSHCWSIMEKPQRQKKHKSSRKIAYSCTMLVLSKYNVFFFFIMAAQKMTIVKSFNTNASGSNMFVPTISTVFSYTLHYRNTSWFGCQNGEQRSQCKQAQFT